MLVRRFFLSAGTVPCLFLLADERRLYEGA